MVLFIKYYRKTMESESVMRKKYIYAITLVVLSISIWAGYYLYLEYKPISYRNGTFVEVPTDISEELKELAA